MRYCQHQHLPYYHLCFVCIPIKFRIKTVETSHTFASSSLLLEAGIPPRCSWEILRYEACGIQVHVPSGLREAKKMEAVTSSFVCATLACYTRPSVVVASCRHTHGEKHVYILHCVLKYTWSHHCLMTRTTSCSGDVKQIFRYIPYRKPYGISIRERANKFDAYRVTAAVLLRYSEKYRAGWSME